MPPKPPKPRAGQPEVLEDPFHVEQGSASQEATPGDLAEEKPAPDTIPAPADHPEPQPEYVPSARRVQE